jgi:hypothetical protein
MAKYASFRELIVRRSRGAYRAHVAIAPGSQACYSLALLTTFAGMQWAVFQILRL